MHVYGAKGSPQILLIVTFLEGGCMSSSQKLTSPFLYLLVLFLFIYFGGGNHNLPMQRCPIRRDEDQR